MSRPTGPLIDKPTSDTPRRCGGYKPANIEPHMSPTYNFHRNSRSKDGLHSTCKDCMRENNRRSNAKNNPIRDLSKYAESYARLRFRYKDNSPPWLTEDHKAEMRIVYDTRTMLNKSAGYTMYHVDHIVPIQGENVSGLHVPWNLRIITAEENLRKKNNYETSI